MLFDDFDYIKDDRDNFYIIRGHFHPKDRVRSPLVYMKTSHKSRRRAYGHWYLKWIDSEGSAFLRSNFPDLVYEDPITKEVYTSVKKDNIVKKLGAREGLQKMLETDGFLVRFTDSLKEYGIRKKDMGMGGSKLTGITHVDYEGWDDFDFVIYGLKNIPKYRAWVADNKDKMINYKKDPDFVKKYVSTKVLLYSPIGFEKARTVYEYWDSPYVDWENEKISPRFVYNRKEAPKIKPLAPKKEIIAKAKVIDNSRGYLRPAIYRCLVNGKEVEVITHLWSFMSLSILGKEVEIYGTLREDNKKEYITLDKNYHYICPTS